VKERQRKENNKKVETERNRKEFAGKVREEKKKKEEEIKRCGNSRWSAKARPPSVYTDPLPENKFRKGGFSFNQFGKRGRRFDKI
jgi:hypothetical protein